MSDDEDDFFGSSRSSEKVPKVINTENKNDILGDCHENTESASRKNIKIIEAKIPTVTAVTDSIASGHSEDSDSDDEDASKASTLSSNEENESKDTNSPNKKPNVKSKLKSDSEVSDDQTVSPLPNFPERQSKTDHKTNGVKKSNSSSSLTKKSAHDKEQAAELKQFLGSQFNGQSRNGAITTGSIRNFSFSNDKLKAIDKENQRLLEKITLYASESRRSNQLLNGNGKTALRKSPANHSRPSSAAINRKMRQKKIDEENMAMLRRLQQARPSKELQALNASRPSSSMSIRSTSMTSLRSGTPKRKTSPQKPEADLTYRCDYAEPRTACSLID